MKQLLLLCIACFFILACEKDSSSPSTSTTKKDCETNHNCTVTWKNAQSKAYSLTINGVVKNLSVAQTVTYTSVASSVSVATCVLDGNTFPVAFPTKLSDCNTSSFQY